jgi:hypothetical protein
MRVRPLDKQQLARVLRIALKLADVEEGTSYGTPAFKRKGRLFARVHQDGESLVVRVDPMEQNLLIASAPGTFFITDHSLNYPWVAPAAKPRPTGRRPKR